MPHGFQRLTSYARPRPITSSDDASAFDCGEQSLNNWLTLRAIKNESDSNSRTFVTLERSTGLIAGYYCLSSHSIAHEDAPGTLRRNAPDPIPVILIGRLAVDSRFAGQGVGSSLLHDALAKGVAAADLVGSRAFLVDALNESAVAFYRRHGFTLMPEFARALYVTLKDMRASICSAADR